MDVHADVYVDVYMDVYAVARQLWRAQRARSQEIGVRSQKSETRNQESGMIILLLGEYI